MKEYPYINSPEFICKKDLFTINFKEPSVISGVVLQGRSDSDNWVESFILTFTLVTGEIKYQVNFLFFIFLYL